MTQYGFYFDSSRCTGCKTCEMACKDYKDLSQTIAFRNVYDYEGGHCTVDANGIAQNTAYAYHLSLACNHCDQPKCLTSCPQGAIEKNAKTGIVAINKDKCTGIGACVEACPYKVPILDKEIKKGVKCDACSDRVAEGKKPICVESCPLRALDFGDIEELRATYGNVAGIAPMPSPEETKPNIVITKCPAAKDPGDKTGFVANEQEVTGVPA